MRKSATIPVLPAIADELIEECGKAWPAEACGLLFAWEPCVVVIPNIAASEKIVSEFVMCPKTARGVIGARGMPIATWHTHPGDTVEPSIEDCEMVVATGLPVVIATLHGAFRWSVAQCALKLGTVA